jgi:hypothetical protein
MAIGTSLDDLIEALAGAVIAAQDQIEKHHLSNLQNYFVEDGEDPRDRVYRPINFIVKVPTTDPKRSRKFLEQQQLKQDNQPLPEGEAEESGEDELMVPYFAIVSNNPLKIQDVEISFEADISDIGESQEEEEAKGKAAKKAAGAEPEPAATAEAPAKQVSADALAARQLLESAERKRKRVTVDMRSGLIPKGRKTAHVKLRVEGGEPTEAAARVLHYLTKLI